MGFFFFFFFFPEKSYKSVIWDKAEKNKGEWSELYTLFRLIDKQNLFPVEQNQEEGERLRLPILSIFRFIDEKIGVEYLLGDSNIKLNINDEETREIERLQFKEWADFLLQSMSSKKGKKASFAIPELNAFRTLACCPKVACVNQKNSNDFKDKSDLYIVIHDTLTGQTPKQGFSIKSEIGMPPTLLNATPLTNFRYRLTKRITEEQVSFVNSMVINKGKKDVVDVRGRVLKIMEYGANLEFYGIQPNKNNQDIFYENLVLIDSCMPQILAWLLLKNYTSGKHKLDELTKMITKENPMDFPMSVNKMHYEAKIKRLIMDLALGLLPGQPWDQTNLASGVLVVKPSGDIECYHVIYKDTLEEYLFHDLKFETPSATRHKFATIEEDENGNQYFALNSQIRFIK